MSLRDELAVVLGAEFGVIPNDYEARIADAMLASEPMQAIRNFCEWFAHRHGTRADMERVLRDEARLPESVIAWVLEEA